MDQADAFTKIPAEKNLYAWRKQTVERSFADAKELYGLRAAHMLGIANMQEQVFFTAAVQNWGTYLCPQEFPSGFHHSLNHVQAYLRQRDGEDTLRFFIYSRKSVYTGKGESIENQIGMCRQYIGTKFAQDCGAQITVYEDEGFSAKDTDRPRFQQMLQDIKTQRPDYVVCYRLDRISRSVGDFSALIEELNEREIAFLCIKEEFDTAKPMGKAMMYIASVFAQLERETIAERVRDNMRMLARSGRWLGGTTPTGYTSEKVQEVVIDDKVKTACRLKEDPLQIRAVDMMFETYLELGSIVGVRKRLVKQGVKSRGGKCYSLPGIKQILQNPVYCMADKEALAHFIENHADVCFGEPDCTGEYGLLAYNKRDYTKKHAPRQGVDKWIVAIGRHKGRVPGAKWAKVQRLLLENIPTGTKPAGMHNGYALLSGLIYCGACGCRMFAKRRTGKNAPPEAFDYVCENKLRGGAALCSCQNINGKQADEMVCGRLMEHVRESGDTTGLLERLRASFAAGTENSAASALDTLAQKRRCEIGNLVHALSQNILDGAALERVNARVQELSQEVRELEQEGSRLRQEGERETEAQAQATAMAQGLYSLKACLPGLSIQEKRSLIKLLTQKIVWDGMDLHLYLDEA